MGCVVGCTCHGFGHTQSIASIIGTANIDWIEIVRSAGIAEILIVILYRFYNMERKHKDLFDQLVIQKWIYTYKFDNVLRIEPQCHYDSKELQVILDRAIATFADSGTTKAIIEIVKHEYWHKISDEYVRNNPIQDNKLKKYRKRAY